MSSKTQIVHPRSVLQHQKSLTMSEQLPIRMMRGLQILIIQWASTSEYGPVLTSENNSFKEVHNVQDTNL